MSQNEEHLPKSNTDEHIEELTMNLNALRREVHELAIKVDNAAARFEALFLTVEKLTANVETFVHNIERLTGIVETLAGIAHSHERRLKSLEDAQSLREPKSFKSWYTA